MAAIRHFTDLLVYQKAFELGRGLFHAAKTWPVEERYALADRARRAVRAIGANIAEAWGKRRYEAHFVSKLSAADRKLLEAEHGLLCARDQGCITAGAFDHLHALMRESGRMPEVSCGPPVRACSSTFVNPRAVLHSAAGFRLLFS